MSRKNTTTKFKVGDYIKIIHPHLVERVGYPLTPAMVYTELNNSENRQRIIDMLHDFDIRPNLSIYNGGISEEEVAGVLKIISYHTVRARFFGGSERKIYTIERPELKDQLFTIQSKKVVRTGTRVPCTGCGENAEPAYLDNPKSHVLLGFMGNVLFDWEILWIQAKDVIKV